MDEVVRQTVRPAALGPEKVLVAAQCVVVAVAVGDPGAVLVVVRRVARAMRRRARPGSILGEVLAAPVAAGSIAAAGTHPAVVVA